MKKIILLLPLFIATLSLSAQKFDIKFSSTYETTKTNPGITAIVGSDAEGFYAVKFGDGHGYLEKINKSGKSLSMNEMVMPPSSYESTKLLSVVYFKDHFVIFTSNFDKDKRTDDLYANFMDLNGKIDNEFHLLDSKTVKREYAAGNFSYEFSNDTSKIMVLHYEDADEKDKVKLTITVYDFNFNKVWKATRELPFTTSEISIQSWEVDNDGNVYMLAEKKNSKGKNPENDFLLFTFQGGELSEPQPIAVGSGKFITDMQFSVDDHGKIVMAGFYSNTRNGGMVGTFYARINPKSNDVEINKSSEFSKEFLATIIKEKDVEKGTGLTGFYHMQNFRVEDDESLFILAENSYVVTSSNGGSAYYYKEIIATHILPDGSIQWQVSVPMYQVGAGSFTNYLGYFVCRVGEDYLLFYNDNPDNLDTYNQDDMKMLKSGKLTSHDYDEVVAIITPNGKMKKTKLFANEQVDKYILFPDVSEKIDEDEVLLYMTKSENYRFARVKIM